MNVLLVTGSRSLGDAALNASREILRDLMSCEGDLALIVGDAVGPDTVAHCLAIDSRKGAIRFCLDGKARQFTPKDGGGYKFDEYDWWNPKDPRPPSQRWPLVRNRHMVEMLRLMSLQERSLAAVVGEEPRIRVLCVGFVDPTSTTRGTDHTLRLARQAGIWTARYVWQGAGFEEQS